jgi:hypothetical protein
MICYLDQSFCSSDCMRVNCERFASAEIKQKAAAFGLPIAYANFALHCASYDPPPDLRDEAL